MIGSTPSGYQDFKASKLFGYKTVNFRNAILTVRELQIKLNTQEIGRGGGIEVRILALYSDDPGLNSAGYLIFLYCTEKR